MTFLSANFLLAIVGSGCGGTDEKEIGDDLPDSVGIVTWDEHIEELLARKCVFCHGADPENGAPSDFRLDKYELTDIGDGKLGAFEKASEIQRRAVFLTPSSMPPGGPLVPEEQTLVDAWVEGGAPRDSTDALAMPVGSIEVGLLRPGQE